MFMVGLIYTNYVFQYELVGLREKSLIDGEKLFAVSCINNQVISVGWLTIENE